MEHNPMLTRKGRRLVGQAVRETGDSRSAEFDAWLARWKAANAALQAETAQLLHEAFAAGETVEEIGVGSVSIPWPSPHYLASGEKLVEHLMARHIGFGTDLVIRGQVREPFAHNA